MNSKDGIMIWLLGASGILFLYSAITNRTPFSIIQKYITPTAPYVPIQGTLPVAGISTIDASSFSAPPIDAANKGNMNNSADYNVPHAAPSTKKNAVGKSPFYSAGDFG